jgi:hypothetical protein
MKNLKRLICLAVVALAVYSGYMLGMPYYKFYAFRSDAADMVKFTIRDQANFKKKVIQKARDYGIPMSGESIQIWETEDKGYRVKASWSETVNILDLYEKTFDFSFEVAEAG